MSSLTTKIFFMKSMFYENVIEKISIFFRLAVDTKFSFFGKVVSTPFFRECVLVTQNGHFFQKNVGKMSDKNSENYVLLRENTFYEKWQSGRINFFWGGFSAFMVYALTLISTRQTYLGVVLSVPQNNTKVSLGNTLATKKIILNTIYRKTVIMSILCIFCNTV